MHRATTDNFASCTATNLAELSRRGPSLQALDSHRSEQRECRLQDMLQLLEVETNARRMLHAPSLQTFMLRRFGVAGGANRKRVYALLRAWRRAARAETPFAVDFQSVYFDDRLEVAYLSSNHTGLYPLKVR